MKKAVKIFISSIILLICASHLQAQYTTFEVKGSVKMSIDGKTWKQLKKKDELKEDYQIRLSENSLVRIIDSKNLIYSYADSKTISVGDIVKQRKNLLAAMNRNSGKHKSIGGVNRPIFEDNSQNDTTEVCSCNNVCVFFNETETLNQYDNSDIIPIGTAFFITICNGTEEDKLVNVYQKDEQEGLLQCFPEDIYLKKNTAVEISEILFGKQENQDNKFLIYYSK